MSDSEQFSNRPCIIVSAMNMDTGKDIARALNEPQPGPPQALPSLKVCQRARQSRDPRFDGRFFIGVATTGIYCRTTCPARMPLEENVRYFVTQAQAQESGFRPCRRCRPEAAQRLPEWTLSSQTILRALRLIEAGYLNEHASAQLAAELGLGERQMNRLMQAELGASAKTIAQICRAKLAKKLLLDTRMKFVDVAYHAGYGSVSRFNSEIRKCFHSTPREIRNGKKLTAPQGIQVQLPLRLPYDMDWIFDYLDKRALAGLEVVTRQDDGWCYQRRVAADAWVRVQSAGDKLIAHLPLIDEPLHSLLTRVRRVFDLNADGQTIHDSLKQDAVLGRWVKRRPGLRVPGAWDGFETAVRAILGQQVSVARGTELADKLIARCGDGLFPLPAALADDQNIAAIGMPGKRGQAIRELAAQVVAGSLTVDECQAYDEVSQALQGLPGIGPWTANYVRMRALKDPDAFPDNDWVVMKALDCNARQARTVAEAWRPWRAYALMYLWFASPEMRARNQQD